MTNSTDVFWDVDGVSLQTLCQNVVSVAPKWTTPEFRGENVQVAYRHGTVHREKYMAARTESLIMWVNAWLPTGGISDLGMQRQFNANMEALRSLLWQDRSREVALTKRWHDPETGTVKSATAQAELISAFSPEMQGPYSARLSVDFLLNDPRYYAPEVVVPLTLNTETPVVYPGNVATEAITLELDGILANPRVTNLSADPEVWVQIGTAIAADDTVTVDIGDMTVRNGDANLIGAMTHGGAPQWLRLGRGTNLIELTASSGGGDATMTYRPAYL